MKLINIILCMSIQVLLACQNKQTHFGNVSTKTIDMDISCLELNDIGEDVEIIPLATADSCLIGKIVKIVEYQDKLFIQDRDQKTIFIFDHKHGSFINKISRIGNGPEEYLHIEDFAINPYTNHIEMIDGRNLRSYDFSGNFINLLRITDDKNIRAVNRIAVVDSTLYAFLTLFDEYGARLYSGKSRSFIKEQNLVPAWTRKKIPFQTANPFYRKNNEINYYEGFSNKIYQISEEGFALKYEWDFGRYNFNYNEPPLINEFKNADSFRDILTKKDYYCNKYIQTFQHNIENKNFIVTCFLYRNEPATLLYNKQNSNYIVCAGGFSKLLMFSKIEITELDEVVMVVDLSLIKLMPDCWFSEKDREIIADTNISDNPLVLKFKIRESIFEKEA